MFTGIVEAMGKVRELSRQGASVSLRVDLSGLAEMPAIGESVSISGVCLTVEQRQEKVALFSLSPETLARTTLKSLRPGSRVNLERALSPQTRLGGHFVTGHVDGTGKLSRLAARGSGRELCFSFPEELRALLAPQGSIAVDGVSLTVASLEGRFFSVVLIPHTLAATTLGALRTGAPVNLEADLLAKYVRAVLQAGLPRGETLSESYLREHGF